MNSTSGKLPESWKQTFFKQKPFIPAVVQLVTAVIIIILGFFGELHVGTPWWSGMLFLISGVSLCLLIRRQLTKLEILCLVTTVFSTLASAAAIIIYSVEFSNPQLFPHYESDIELTYRVDASLFALCSFELGISIWILIILAYSWKGTVS